MIRIRLGTRGSRLAMTQARHVASALEGGAADVEIELVEIRTRGDRHPDIPLGPELGQSIFTSEIESALLQGRIDLAVHSCKDLSTTMPRGLDLTAVPAREDPRDALVTNGPTLAELPAGARVGTSSPRRRAFVRAARPDLRVEDLRGNVPARLRSVETGALDAAILAVAGLRRLALADRIVEMLDPDVMLPAAAQGALALQCREGDSATANVVTRLDDADSRARVTAERACLRRLGAGCQAPVGALATIDGSQLRLVAAVCGPGEVVRAETTARPADAESMGQSAADRLLEQLGLESLRDAPWAGAPPLRSPRAGDPDS